MSKGRTSKIKYLEGFCKYTQLADRLQATPHGRKTIIIWEKYVFEGISDAVSEPEEEDGDYEDMLADFDADAALDQEMERLEGEENDLPLAPTAEAIIEGGEITGRDSDLEAAGQGADADQGTHNFQFSTVE